MRVVQTFWTSGQSLLENTFGWLTPQHHLMSWALSCLSLRKNYGEVVLYTDSEGCKVFADLLELPYTDVEVRYDRLSCPQPHWAYPKMLTYSRQTEPFIHVDGDLYIPRRLDERVEQGGLIAQNVEIGTGYYKGMMNGILQRDISLPDFLQEELKRDSIRAYNAGVLGGSDLDFIQEYCRTAFRIIERNDWNALGDWRAHVNDNLLYEQVLFFTLAHRQEKSVACVIDRGICDNGYLYDEFCDFYRYDHVPMMHILGGYKRNPRICALLGKTLLDKYPEFYRRILALFPRRHGNLQSAISEVSVPDLSVQRCVAAYQAHVRRLQQEWRQIPVADLYEQERRSSFYPAFLNAEAEAQNLFLMARNPYLDIFEMPDNWSPKAKVLLQGRIGKGRYFKHADIACVPTLLGEGFSECLINDLAYDLLLLLRTERTFGDLCDMLKPCFSPALREDRSRMRRLVLDELEPMFYHGLIYTKER